ncbi:hypothetical protein [Muricoccus vinaceus]|uniref:Uncharacterized protein n=1 Tax=Muricoccus vinaceus TaxID=424704 RepID=A0ABV6J2G5_9PROT
MVNRIAESARANAAKVAADYVTALSTEDQRDFLDSFWMSGGKKYSLFKSGKNEERVVAVKVIPYRCKPTLVTMPTTPDTDQWQMASEHPQLAQIQDMRGYHWETPEYRKLCVDLNLDPDEGRPVFRASYEELGERLVVWIADHFDSSKPWGDEPAEPPEWADVWDRPRYEPHTRRMAGISALCDFVDLLLDDADLYAAEIDALRRKFSYFPLGFLPWDAELRSMLAGDEFLEVGRQARGSGGGARRDHNRLGSAVEVEFLPSRYGTGHRCVFSTSYADWEDPDEDGWPARNYSDVRGVAVLPTDETIKESAWLSIVMDRLRRQGVLFLPESEVQKYLNTEGTFWVHQDHSGYFPLKRPIRKPSLGEQMLWKVKRPYMPIDRELVRLEALHPIP